MFLPWVGRGHRLTATVPAEVDAADAANLAGQSWTPGRRETAPADLYATIALAELARRHGGPADLYAAVAARIGGRGAADAASARAGRSRAARATAIAAKSAKPPRSSRPRLKYSQFGLSRKKG